MLKDLGKSNRAKDCKSWNFYKECFNKKIPTIYRLLAKKKIEIIRNQEI